MKRKVGMLILAAVLACGSPAGAVVNPALQPIHLFERYNAVLAATVTAIDSDAPTAELKISQVIKGTFSAGTVTIKASDENMKQALEELNIGQTVVAFVGTKRARHELDLLTYTGAGSWQVGVMESAKNAETWQWTEDPNADETNSMFGTFNGAEGRLAEMMQDMARGVMFFPPIPFTQFRPGTAIDRFDKPLRGVALYDVDGDGRLDIYACCQTGNRLYLQTDDMKFADATGKLNLTNVASVSCSFADVNADGKADLLAGGKIYVADKQGFAPGDLLPPQADENVKSSAFVEINGDGYPDVVVSRIDGGLSVYLNGGAKGGRFTDATAATGLDKPDCGVGLNGFFAPGDWNGDGRTDLFYAAGKGLLLIQGADGVFRPTPHQTDFNFQTGADAVAGMSGAGAFAAIWRQDGSDLVVPTETEFNLVTFVDEKPADMACLGNEISEAGYKQLLTVAEDLNADGYVDIYTTSWSPVNGNTFHTNRGYGSFMRDEKYKVNVFPSPAHGVGAWGVAAGDVNGDGANDLLIGGVDGTLTLLINDTLSGREPAENPVWHDRKLQQTCILAARVSGSVGVLGATATLTEAATGRTVGKRVIGANVATGCRGPDTINLAVREPGKYVLTVRFADGHTQKWEVELGKDRLRRLHALREEGVKVAAPAGGGR